MERTSSDSIPDIRSVLNTTDLLRQLKYKMLKLKSPPLSNYAKTVADIPRNFARIS